MDGLAILILCVVSFFIGVFITRWVFGISTIIKSLKQISYEQTVTRRIISEIAKKQGIISHDEIDQIIDRTKVDHK